MEIKGYITNLGKYNEGRLVGEWITFPIDEDDLNEVLKRIGCDYYEEDENGDAIWHEIGYDEYFFTDWETEFANDFGEYESIDKINKLAETLENWDDDTFNAACEIWGVKEVIDTNPDDYYLHPDIHNNYDLGYYWMEESGCYYKPDNDIFSRYFDYESFGRDIQLESNGGMTRYGWIEYVG